jgi:hypothetical protein
MLGVGIRRGLRGRRLLRLGIAVDLSWPRVRASCTVSGAMNEAPLPATDASLDAELQAMKPSWHTLDVVGLVLGLIPFALSYSVTTSAYSSTTVNGGFEVGTQTTHHMDYVALAGGGGAILCAIVSLAMIGRMRSRGVRLGVFAALLALGGLQVIRGVLTIA